MNNDNWTDLFGEPIYSYTRKQALEDGVLIDVSSMAREAGINYPVAVTSELYHGYIEPTEKEKEHGQDLNGRLWDTLFLFASAARKTEGDIMRYQVIYIKEQDDGTVKTETQEIKGVIGPGDDPSPVITLMLPHES